MGARYSPDGECLMVFGSWGCKVYESATGELLHTLVDKEGAVVLNCYADASSKFLVSVGISGSAFVKELRSGERLCELDHRHELDQLPRNTSGGTFDSDSARMAYFVRVAHHSRFRGSLAHRKSVGGR